ncbi:hypothetical protein J2S43_005451 [Catenuloplanes nepalensis]|uniref:DUF2637 domain-containing protein n=1 Tax=Catenuloplanes nepalensis TaxID=587533 RepID=A0ABT9MZV8_9ACTN|nr:hypothetical protein [Catenuloplanes nepalensis]
MTLSQLLRIRWAVRATLLLGVAASVVANVLHAVDNPISQTIAAWPPFALLLTVELISRVPVHRKSLAFIRMLATTAIAGIAAWISYWHMAGVAAKYGETGASAYLLPISVDGLIVVASICLIELGGRISEAQAAKRAAAETAAAGTAAATAAAGTAAETAWAGAAPAGDAAPGQPVPGELAPARSVGAGTRPGPAAAPIAAGHRPGSPRPVARTPHPDSGEEWFGDQDRLTDDDVPGIAALVPRPLTAAAGTPADAYARFADVVDGPAPEQGYATDEYRLVDADDRRRTADRLAAGGAMAVAAGARRDRDPMTTTGSQPMLASDVAAAVEAALNGRPVARGVRGGASPRSRASISAASGSLSGRAAVPEDGQLDAEPSAAPDDARQDEPASNGQPPRLPAPGVPAPRAGVAATRGPVRTSAASSATRQTTTGRITTRTGPGGITGSVADTGRDGADTGRNGADTGRNDADTGRNGADTGRAGADTGRAGRDAAGTAPNGTGAPRPRRSAAETAALAADIEARNPGISEAAVADELGITTRRLREVRRATDTLPA